MRTLLLILALVASVRAQTFGGAAMSGGGYIVGGVSSGPITGGQVTIPLTIVGHPQSYFLNDPVTGQTWYSLGGTSAPTVPTTDPGGGLWYTNTAAAEANPAGVTWTAANHATQPSIGGDYIPIRRIVGYDSDTIVMVDGYSGQSGTCTVGNNCASTITVFKISTQTYTTVQPIPAGGQSYSCLTKDSTNTFFAMVQYAGGALWKSPTGTPYGTWTQVATGYQSLPGLSGAANGNIYVCKVLGSRIYFGGEAGVMSCDLAFSACTIDYLPNLGGSQRNFQALLGDQNEGVATNPTVMAECCKNDVTLTNFVDVGLFSGGSWNGLTSTSGLPQFQQPPGIFDTFSTTTGSGSGRRYYFVQGGTSPPYVIYKSTSSTGANWALLTPSGWPTSTTTNSLLQINSSSADHMWGLFSGTTGVNTMWITP